MKFCDVEISFAPTRNWNIARTLTLAYLGAALVALLSSGIRFWLSGGWFLPGWFLTVTAAVVIFAFADAGWIIWHGYFSGWIDPVDAIGKFLQKGWSWAAIRNFSQEKQARYHRGLDLIEKTKENIIRDGKRDWIIGLVHENDLETARRAYKETVAHERQYRERVREALVKASRLNLTDYVCDKLGVQKSRLESYLLRNGGSLVVVHSALSEGESLLEEARTQGVSRRVKEALEFGTFYDAKPYVNRQPVSA